MSETNILERYSLSKADIRQIILLMSLAEEAEENLKSAKAHEASRSMTSAGTRARAAAINKEAFLEVFQIGNQEVQAAVRALCSDLEHFTID